ncbi:Sterol 3-beta, partial [Globisporangium polare]
MHEEATPPPSASAAAARVTTELEHAHTHKFREWNRRFRAALRAHLPHHRRRHHSDSSDTSSLPRSPIHASSSSPSRLSTSSSSSASSSLDQQQRGEWEDGHGLSDPNPAARGGDSFTHLTEAPQAKSPQRQHRRHWPHRTRAESAAYRHMVENVETAGIAIHDSDGKIVLEIAEEDKLDLVALKAPESSQNLLQLAQNEEKQHGQLSRYPTLQQLKQMTVQAAIPTSEAEAKSYQPPPVMSICIMIVGTRGDVQPFIGIAKRLQIDGHRVRLATHAVYRDFVTEHGVEFYPLGGDPKELAAYMVKTGGHLIPLNFEAIQKDVPRNLQMIEEILHSTWPAVSAADPDGLGPGIPGLPFEAQAIISNPVTYGHIHVAERLGVPLHIMFP